jgi:hypothetical protein
MFWSRRNKEKDAPKEGAGGDGVPEGFSAESALRAAERAAAGIRDDAQEWARRYKEESRKQANELTSERVRELSELTDSLMTRLDAAARQAEELISTLEETGRRLLNSEGRSPEAPRLNRPGAEVEEEPERAFKRAAGDGKGSRKKPWLPPGAEPRVPEPVNSAPPRPARGDPTVSEGARLLATQMAAVGGKRDEVASRLREEFGIQDPAAILDEIGL